MAAFEAVERLQKFDWLIQKLHSLRSTFNSEQGIQELQKLHALQLLHRNGIPFNEQISENEEVLEEKINDEELDQEDDEDLEDIEEDTEVLDDEEDENEEHPQTPKSETGHTTTSTPNPTSNGSHTNEMYGLQPKNGISIQNLDYSKPNKNDDGERESGDNINNSDNANDPRVRDERFANDGLRHGRFSTGLFPPLPFDNLFDENQLKVGDILF